ncbi:MAG: hypothetical protein PHE83_00095 [Opitutaceae bacterium]|nr:hypothetical protein [Opitutaceae bacterium]
MNFCRAKPIRGKILSGIVLILTAASASLLGKSTEVTYSPLTKIVEGFGPYSQSYTLTMTPPSPLAAGSHTISFQASVVSVPVDSSGNPLVTDATALGHISISPASVTVTGGSAPPPQNVTVTVSFPSDAVVGDYAYHINTTGWPSGVATTGANINLTIQPPTAPPSTPAVAINQPASLAVFTYTAGGPPLQIPFSFAATTAATDPVITNVDADLNGTALAVTSGGLSTDQVTGSGTIQVAAAGTYALTTRAYNSVGTGSASVEFTVNVAGPAPTLVIQSPSDNAVFSYASGGTGVTVPVSISATSAYGGVQAITATLNGSPLSLAVQGLGASPATGSTSLQLSAAGTYTLSVSVTDALGTATASSHFSVTVQQPAPVIVITQPATGSGPFALPPGGGPLAVPFAFTANVGFGNIDATDVSLNGTAVTALVTGLGTPAVAGTGEVQISTPGDYTFTVMATSNGVTSTSSTSFTVNQALPPPQYSVLWLPPVSLGKAFQGGCTVPVKFSLLDATGGIIQDRSIVVAIYEVLPNGGVSSPTLFTHGPRHDHDPGTYMITRKHYQLDYRVNRGVHTYQIDVYAFWPPTSGNANLLGTTTITTKRGNHGHDDNHGDDGHHGDEDDHDNRGKCRGGDKD